MPGVDGMDGADGADGNQGIPGPTLALNASQHILSVSFTLAADMAVIIPRYHHINSGVTLLLESGSTFSIN